MTKVIPRRIDSAQLLHSVIMNPNEALINPLGPEANLTWSVSARELSGFGVYLEEKMSMRTCSLRINLKVVQ